MVPAIPNCICSNCFLGSLQHVDHLKKVQFINVFFSCIIHLNCTKAKLMAVMCFRSHDDPRIKWLDICSHICSKKLDLNVGRLICYIMTREIVNQKNDFSVLCLHTQIEAHKPSTHSSTLECQNVSLNNSILFKNNWCHPCSFIGMIEEPSCFLWCRKIFKSMRVSILSNKHGFCLLWPISIACKP